jgi:23S rRNA pseudouridine2605 synthase
MAEKAPRQPRKPFQNTGRRIIKKTEGRRQETGDRRQETGDRRQETGDRRQKTGDRRQKSEGRRLETGDRRQKTGERIQKTGDRSQKSGGRRQESSEGYRKAKPFKPGDNEERPARKIARKKADYSVERADGKRRPRVEKGEGHRPKRRAGTSRSEDESRPVKPLSPRKYPSRRGVKFKPNSEKDGIRLNKYIANAGICSRREADQLIVAGVIKVNDIVVTTLGAKVMPGDKVKYSDQTISNEKKRYLLLNKQKGYVTTTKDPHAKNTVMELIEGACKERIYPVGRLDRNTTGLLLFTNDGEIAKKLMHPSSRIKKMYHVVLDQPVSKADMLKIADGIVIDDDRVQIDSIAYVEDAKDRREIGLELHSGQNRVVRRVFESLGYKVTKLDRVMYAGLTKKGISRGKWRFLNEQEVIRLKMLR